MNASLGNRKSEGNPRTKQSKTGLDVRNWPPGSEGRWSAGEEEMKAFVRKCTRLHGASSKKSHKWLMQRLLTSCTSQKEERKKRDVFDSYHYFHFLPLQAYSDPESHRGSRSHSRLAVGLSLNAALLLLRRTGC